jgi:hypothetical protein
MRRGTLFLAALGAVMAMTAGGCASNNPKKTVLNLDTTDPKWTSRKCVQARRAVYEYDDHGNMRLAVGIAGNLVVPFAGTAGSLALNKRQDKAREPLNARVRAACISRKRRRG